MCVLVLIFSSFSWKLFPSVQTFEILFNPPCNLTYRLFQSVTTCIISRLYPHCFKPSFPLGFYQEYRSTPLWRREVDLEMFHRSGTENFRESCDENVGSEKPQSREGRSSLLGHMGACPARISVMNQSQNMDGILRPNLRIWMRSLTSLFTTKQL